MGEWGGVWTERGGVFLFKAWLVDRIRSFSPCSCCCEVITKHGANQTWSDYSKECNDYDYDYFQIHDYDYNYDYLLRMQITIMITIT